jgi:hypothetical protein
MGLVLPEKDYYFLHNQNHYLIEVPYRYIKSNIAINNKCFIVFFEKAL